MARRFLRATPEIGKTPINLACINAYPYTFACWVLISTAISAAETFLGIFTSTNAGECSVIGMDTTQHPQVGHSFTSGAAMTFGTSATALTIGRWTHIAGVFTNATNRAIWVDGVSAATDVTSLAFPPTQDSCAIGALNTLAGGNGTTGDIAECAMWNVALLAPDLLKLANGFRPDEVSIGSLVFYVPMRDGSNAAKERNQARQRVGNSTDPLANGDITWTGTSPSPHPPKVRESQLLLPAWYSQARPPHLKTPVVTGTTQFLTVGGGLTPAGALFFQVNLGPRGGLTPSGVAKMQVSKALSGALTPTGKAILQAQKAFTGGETPTGKVIFQVNKGLSGPLTPSGVVAKQIGKSLGGGETPTGVVAKQVNKLLGGGLTPTGVLTTLKVVLLALSGALTPTGKATMQAQKALGGGLTPVGTLVRQILKGLSGAITPVGTYAFKVLKSMGGGLTPTGALSTIKVVLLSVGGTIAPTGKAAMQVAKSFGGISSPSGSLRFLVAKVLGGVTAPAGTLSVLVKKTLGGGLSPTGLLTTVKVVLLSAGGALTPTGKVAFSVGKGFGGVLAPSGALAKKVLKVLGGLLTPVGTLTTQGGTGPGPTSPGAGEGYPTFLNVSGSYPKLSITSQSPLLDTSSMLSGFNTDGRHPLVDSS